MGEGPLGLWSFAGINICPFTQSSICSMLVSVKDLLVTTMGTEAQTEYYSLANVFQIFRPSLQVLSPYCADPLTFDHFSGKCAVQGFCEMFASTVPNLMQGVMFTMEQYVF